MVNEPSNSANGGARRPWITTVAILLVVLLAVGAYLKLRPRRIRISVVQPALQAVSSSITTNGKIEPIHSFEAHAPLAVTVKKVLIKEGDRVKAGQLLLVLDDSRARSDLALARTRLKTAQAGYSALLAGGSQQQLLVRQADRQKAITDRDAAQRQLSSLERLQQRGAASPDEVAAARDRFSRAQADLAQLDSQVRYSPQDLARSKAEIADAEANIAVAQETIRNSNIRAPFDGTVYYLPARLGAFVNAGELLLQEADLSQMQVRAFVDEPELGRLAVGETTKITWDALPGRTWQGTVTTVPSTVVNRGSRVVGEVLCKFDNSDRLLLPNLNVSVTIIANSKDNALTVPREAVREDAGHSFLYVLQGNRLHRREIKLGISNLTRVEILSGISQNDIIAVHSFSPAPFSDGVEVKIVENPS
ncbi:MAG: efflux transporter periplasmic adaptor subunit [Acidobacteria bacterium]|nr:MAG: efflux transporter periplasmic adaptor subunit [Acidobacteriota bacterium]